MRYLKALVDFAREFHDITEHARTGRKPARRKPGTERR